MAMGEVYGGAPDSFFALLDNDDLNVTKAFGFKQADLASLENQQAIAARNGILEAPVQQDNTFVAG